MNYKAFFLVPLILVSSILTAVVMPVEEQNEEGVIYQRNMDGTETITAPDGSRYKIMPADKKVPQLRDTVVQEEPDDEEQITTPDDNRIDVRETEVIRK